MSLTLEEVVRVQGSANAQLNILQGNKFAGYKDYDDSLQAFTNTMMSFVHADQLGLAFSGACLRQVAEENLPERFQEIGHKDAVLRVLCIVVRMAETIKQLVKAGDFPKDFLYDRDDSCHIRPLNRMGDFPKSGTDRLYNLARRTAPQTNKGTTKWTDDEYRRFAWLSAYGEVATYVLTKSVGIDVGFLLGKPEKQSALDITELRLICGLSSEPHHRQAALVSLMIHVLQNLQRGQMLKLIEC